MSPLVLIADVISLCFRGALIVIIVRKGLTRSYPRFSAYLIFSICSTIARLLVRNHYALFFYLFWTTEAVYAVLSVLVIVEIFHRVFRDLYENRAFRLVLGCLGVIILAVILGLPTTHHVDAAPVTAVILTINLVLRLVQVSTLVLFLSFVVLLDLRRRRRDLAIILGYGLFAVVYLIALALRSQLGKNYDWSVTLGHPIAYDCATGIWLFAFSSSQPRLPPEQPTGASKAEQMAAQLGYFTEAQRRISSRQWMG
jgi:hypothetical protein